MARFTAREIADWFLAWADVFEADVTNLSVQTLLYYAQGHYLALNNAPLFDDEIQAWARGPVVPSLYRAFDLYGSGPIDSEEIGESFDWEQYKTIESLLMDVWERYGSLAAWALREKAQREPPWREAFADALSHREIGRSQLRNYFLELG